jgi:hypothetical protein
MLPRLYPRVIQFYCLLMESFFLPAFLPQLFTFLLELSKILSLENKNEAQNNTANSWKTKATRRINE